MFKPVVIAGLVAALPSALWAAGTLEDALSELAAGILGGLPEGGAPTMAISTFTHSGNTCSDLSNYISELMLPSLATAGKNSLRLIARSQLSGIFRELRLVYDGTISPGAAQEIGKISAVEAILTGTITPFGDSMMVMSTLIATSDGGVLGSATANFPITDTVRSLVQEQNAALCGFAPAAASVVPAPVADAIQASPPSASNGAAAAPVPESYLYTSADVAAEVITLAYTANTGAVAWSIRFSNPTKTPLGVSFVRGSMSISDGSGGTMSGPTDLTGVKVCTYAANGFGYCNTSNPDLATTIPPGKFAQMNFFTTATKDLPKLLATLTMDLVVTPDTGQKDSFEARTIGFFDMAPRLR